MNCINESWTNWAKHGVVKTIKLNILKLTPEQNSNISSTNNDLLINMRMFNHHIEFLLKLLSAIICEEDIEVLTVNEVREILRKSNSVYQDIHLNSIITYLIEIKKVAIFKVKIENVDVDCIKILRDPNSKVTEKDTAIINIMIQVQKLERKINK
jgi:hypothetical protein